MHRLTSPPDFDFSCRRSLVAATMTFFLTLVSQAGFAQSVSSADGRDDEFTELFYHVLDREYDKAIKKGEKFTQKRRTSSHPLPHYYLARTYLSIHHSDDRALREEYGVNDNRSRALAKSLWHARKFVELDQDGTYLASDEWRDEIEELREAYSYQALFDFQDGFLTRALRYLDVIRMFGADPGATLLSGTIFYSKNEISQADSLWQEGKSLTEAASIGKLSDAQKMLLEGALVETLGKLSKADDSEKTTEFLLFAESLFPQNWLVQQLKKELDN